MQGIPAKGTQKDVAITCDSGAQEVRDENGTLEGYDDVVTCEISDLNSSTSVVLKDLSTGADMGNVVWIQHQGATELRADLPVWEFHPAGSDPLTWRKLATLHLQQATSGWIGTADGRIRLP